MRVYEEIREALAANQTALLVSSWESGGDGTSIELKQRVVDAAASHQISLGTAALESGKPAVQGGLQTGEMVEPFFPEDRLIVLGGGHVAVPLVEFAVRCGFSVTVVDDREEFANRERFPGASQTLCMGFDEALSSLNIHRQDYVCILTRGHKYDKICLQTILSGEEPGYLGMIGSRRRVAVVKEELAGSGYDPRALERLHSPIGLKIGAITPAEIAVSILAELIAAKRMTQDETVSRTRSDLDYKVIEGMAAGDGCPKVLLTVVAASGSVPRGAGAKMLVYQDGRTVGSIGGGGSEALAMRIAREIVGTGEVRLEKIELTQDAAAEDGMVCGGSQLVMIQDISEG